MSEEKEKIENLPPAEPAKDAGAAGGKGGNPMVPVILMVVLLPALSFVMIQFLLVPKMKSAVESAVQAATAQHAEGEGAAGAEHAPKKEAAKEGGHGAPKEKKDAHGGGKKKEAGGHGGGHGGKGGESAASGQTYAFEDIVVNLSGALYSRYLKVSFTVEGADPEFASKIEENKTKLIDATLNTLSAVTLVQMEQPGFKNILKNDLIMAFGVVLKEDIVENLYFSEFVVQ